MSQAEGVNVQRRRVLIASTAAIGAAGVAAVATPLSVLGTQALKLRLQGLQ